MGFLPERALAIICTYNMSSIRVFMGVCAQWHFKIREGFDKLLKDAENDFMKENSEYLDFKSSFLSTLNIEFCGEKGL
jgi:hypothetical protein